MMNHHYHTESIINDDGFRMNDDDKRDGWL